MDKFVNGVNVTYMEERKNSLGMIKASAMITYKLLTEGRGEGQYQMYSSEEFMALNNAWHQLQEAYNLISRLNDKIEGGLDY